VHANLLDILAGQGHVPEAAQRLVDALPAAGRANTPPKPETAVLGRLRATTRREKCFGLGRPRALDRNAKVRIMHWARCLSRRTEKGRAYGVITAKALAVLEALLWAFHNAKSGLCFPSYERIAEAAGCARSTVAEALKALEDAGLLTWIHRIKRMRVPCVDLFGNDGVKIVPQRTSNAYNFFDPGGGERAQSPESEKPTRTANQEFFSSFGEGKDAASRRKEAFRGVQAQLLRQLSPAGGTIGREGGRR
jgi:Helix-turn-helix domain